MFPKVSEAKAALGKVCRVNDALPHSPVPSSILMACAVVVVVVCAHVHVSVEGEESAPWKIQVT